MLCSEHETKSELPEIFTGGYRMQRCQLTLLIAETSLKGMNRDEFIKLCGEVYNRLNVSC